MSDGSSNPVEIDGPGHNFQDSLLEEFVGRWSVTGTVSGEEVRLSCHVEWVLNHQFLKVHFFDAAPQKSVEGKPDPRYEAMVFLGYDNMSERYVAHWLDIFGGRFSEALGFGRKDGENSIKFVFEYGGPLHNTISFDPRTAKWRMLIVQKDARGEWKQFADETFERA